MFRCKDVSFAYEVEGEVRRVDGEGAAPESDGDGICSAMDEAVLDVNTPRSVYALSHVNVAVSAGQFVLLCGASGCGKTTLTHLVNGLVPHFFEGELTGEVELDGTPAENLTLFNISALVGSVFQNPRSQFFSTDATSEIAFGPENHGLPEAEVMERVERVSQQLGVEALLGRSIFALSGGEKQRVACASAAAMEPRVYVFDEPSSNLDASSIGDLRALLETLKRQGTTVILAEHRLHYLIDLVDRVLFVRDGRIAGDYTAAEFRALPAALRERMGLRPLSLDELQGIACPRTEDLQETGPWLLRNFHFAYRNSAHEALHIDEATLPGGRATAVIGCNGAGKTTFLRALCGLERCRGVLSQGNHSFSAKQRLRQCYLVMQDVNHQLFTESVAEEVLLSMAEEDTQRVRTILEQMDLTPYSERHPMSLSGGQKQRVAIASAIASKRPLIAFDEPTSGLDLFHMRQVAEAVNDLVEAGRTVVVVTHDPEFILRCCDTVLHLENGCVRESYSLASPKNRARLLDFFKQQGC